MAVHRIRPAEKRTGETASSSHKLLSQYYGLPPEQAIMRKPVHKRWVYDPVDSSRQQLELGDLLIDDIT
jgi:hypothetical protein